jgi:hypothetical protein
MSKRIHTEIEIESSADRVWQVLTDFGRYPEWNPFIPRIDGRPETGEQLDATLTPPTGKAMRFKPRVVAVESGRQLRWFGHLFVPGLFDGEHSFRIEPIDSTRVRFVQEEVFTGVLASPILHFAGQATQHGFEAMNAAIKARVEGGN